MTPCEASVRERPVHDRIRRQTPSNRAIASATSGSPRAPAPDDSSARFAIVAAPGSRASRYPRNHRSRTRPVGTSSPEIRQKHDRGACLASASGSQPHGRSGGRNGRAAAARLAPLETPVSTAKRRRTTRSFRATSWACFVGARERARARGRQVRMGHWRPPVARTPVEQTQTP
jgi:hypothetical protein